MFEGGQQADEQTKDLNNILEQFSYKVQINTL